MLRLVQGQWPPPSPLDVDVARFRDHLVGRGLGRQCVQRYCFRAGLFLEYLQQQGTPVASVRPSDVAAYFRVALRLYRKRKPTLPNNIRCWRSINRWAIDSLLRFVQGQWPPAPKPAPLVLQFKAYLEESRYSGYAIRRHFFALRHFLNYLRERNIKVETVCPADLADFFRTKLEQYQRRHGRLPRDPGGWRAIYTAPLHLALRIVHQQWPPPEAPTSDPERYQHEVCKSYGRWLTEVHGFSKETLRKNSKAAQLFLRFLGNRANRDSLHLMSLAGIDEYLSWRMTGLRRATQSGVCHCLRSFLRYLHSARLIPQDLAAHVSGPILYGSEEIPRAFTEKQVQALLDTTQRDRTPKGLRDYAMLMMLATYGLRAGEVIRLCLDDIDWREECFRIRRSKTGVESFLPLMAAAGEALLDYLEHGRPPAAVREVFLQVRAPYGPFLAAGSLDKIIDCRLKQAGIEVKGRHGSHAFRFARAQSLLRASVPLKSIGDVLGHRRIATTETYLRLATDDLRAISLECPAKERDACLAG